MGRWSELSVVRVVKRRSVAISGVAMERSGEVGWPRWGKTGGSVGVQEDEVGRDEGVQDLLPTSRCAMVARFREPRRAVSIKVPQEKGIIPGGKEKLEGGSETGGT